MSTIAAAPAPAAVSYPAVPPLRSRRKCAKAAAAFVAATVKQEMSLPDEDEEQEEFKTGSRPRSPQSSHKRAYARTSSHGSASSALSAASAGHNAVRQTPKPPKTLKRHISGGGGGGSGGAAASSKKKTALSSYAVEYLKAWMMSPDHIEHPYPTEDEKVIIMQDTAIELKQLTNWFVNNRKRYWKPKVEELRRQMMNHGNGVTLQEMAAAAQAANGGSVQAAAARAAGIRQGGGGSSSTSSSGVVSTSEGEESSSGRKSSNHNHHGSSNKKRKKYSTLSGVGDKHHHPAAAAAIPTSTTTVPGRCPRKVKDENEQDSLLVANPMAAGIHTAQTYESVKAARKLSHESLKTMNVVSSSSLMVSSTSCSSEESFIEERGKQLKLRSLSGVSDPLAAPLLLAPPIATVLAPSLLSSNMALLPPVVSASGVITTGHNTQGLVAQDMMMDYTIAPLDDEVANPKDSNGQETQVAIANQAANDAAVVCQMGTLPHSCNLADPKGATCALCSACRDWNAGEFCPWDLTGILGDLSTEGMELPDLTPSSAAGGVGAADVTITAGVTTLASSDSFGTMEDASDAFGTTEESVGSLLSRELLDDDQQSKASIPQEILGHSTSAADFMSSMADIEAWE